MWLLRLESEALESRAKEKRGGKDLSLRRRVWGLCLCACVFSRRVVLRSDRSFLPKRPEGQNNCREVMEVWVGASLAIPWWESKEEGLVCGFCLSVPFYLCLTVCSPTAYGANGTARDRENNCTGREGERNAVLTVTPNVFRGNLQLEVHKAGILATQEERKKSPHTLLHTHIHSGVSGQTIFPSLF